jgi:hypothetical protein
VGLATVMVLTFTTPVRLEASGLLGLEPAPELAATDSLDGALLPWDPAGLPASLAD